jgi:hypothetical protein
LGCSTWRRNRALANHAITTSTKDETSHEHQEIEIRQGVSPSRTLPIGLRVSRGTM